MEALSQSDIISLTFEEWTYNVPNVRPLLTSHQMQDLSKSVIMSTTIFPRVRGFTVQSVYYRPDLVWVVDTVASVAVLFFPPRLWRDWFSYSSSLSLYLSHFTFWKVEWKSPLIPAFPSLKHWSQIQPSKGSPCHRSCSFCLPSQLWFFGILRSQPVIFICCCKPGWNLCAMIFINPFHWFCYIYLLGQLLFFWVLFNIVNTMGSMYKGHGW